MDKKEMQEAYSAQLKRKDEYIEKLEEKNKLLMNTSQSLSEKLKDAEETIQKLRDKIKVLENGTNNNQTRR